MKKIKFIRNSKQYNAQCVKFDEDTKPYFDNLIKHGITYCQQAAATSTEPLNKCLMYKSCCQYQDDNLQCRFSG